MLLASVMGQDALFNTAAKEPNLEYAPQGRYGT
jgi:hypothetical protein